MSIRSVLMPWNGKLFWMVFFLALWQILLRAQNPGLMTDDSGETVTAAWNLGIGHGPGYSLYTLLGRLATFAPLGTAAFRMNLLSALFLLLALFFVLKACRRLWRQLVPLEPAGPMEEMALVFAALSFLFCESVFAQGLTAKGGIHTSTLFNLAFLLWLCTRENAAGKLPFILFFWSTGMSDLWQAQIFWLILLGVLFARKMVRENIPKACRVFSFVLLGFSTYLYLPLRAVQSPALNWENPRTLDAFWGVVSRRSSPAEEIAARRLGDYVWNIREYEEVMIRHWMPGFVLLAIIGAWFLFRRRRRLAWALLSCYAALAAAIVQISHFNTPYTRYLEAIFFVSTQVFPAVLGLAGLAALYSRWVPSRPKTAACAVLTLVLAAAAWGGAVFERQQKSRYTLAEDFVVNLFQELPFNAVVVLDSDLTIMPELYLKHVEGKRPDLAIVLLPSLYSPWGFRQVVAENEKRVNVSGAVAGFQDAVRLLMDPERFRSSGVFYAYDKSILEKSRMADLAGRLAPWGLSYHLAASPPGAQEASAFVWTAASHQRLRNLDHAANLPGTEFTVLVYPSHYARPHTAAGNLLLKSGLLYPAVRHYRRALEIHPKMQGVYMNLADHFMAAGYPEMAELFCRREIEAHPDSALAHRTRGNILLKMGLHEQAVEAFDRSLEIEPGSTDAFDGREKILRQGGEPPSAPAAMRRKAEDYLSLGRKYERDGEAYLASVAYDTARGMETFPGPPSSGQAPDGRGARSTR